MTVAAILWMSVAVLAQNTTVKGNVKDISGEPIIGASIVVIGTSQGTITDVDGNFTLPNVAEGASIEVTYIGYISQTLKATAAAMNIILKEDSQALEEVVVIGYGVQKKSVVTASIAKVGEDVLTQTSPMRMDNALKG